jgi:hypothetical protein
MNAAVSVTGTHVRKLPMDAAATLSYWRRGVPTTLLQK